MPSKNWRSRALQLAEKKTSPSLHLAALAPRVSAEIQQCTRTHHMRDYDPTNPPPIRARKMLNRAHDAAAFLPCRDRECWAILGHFANTVAPSACPSTVLPPSYMAHSAHLPAPSPTLPTAVAPRFAPFRSVVVGVWCLAWCVVRPSDGSGRLPGTGPRSGVGAGEFVRRGVFRGTRPRRGAGRAQLFRRKVGS